MTEPNQFSNLQVETPSTVSPNLERGPHRWRSTIQMVGLIAGPIMAAICFVTLPTEYQDAAGQLASFSNSGRATLAVMIWMAVWWLTEAIDIATTALLPLATFPMFGIADMESTAAPFAHPLIFLLMGGFLLALSMSRWGLDRRIALVTLRIVGTKPMNMVGGFMLITAVLSAFVSNTATTAMMLPIALSIVALTNRGRVDGTDSHSDDSIVSQTKETRDDQNASRNLATCLMLGIAYAASIGGVATIIGTPTNAFLISFVKSTIAEPYRVEISFIRWMSIGVPFAVVFLPIVWVFLTRVIYPIRDLEIAGGKQLIEHEYRSLGKVSRGEWATLIVFSLTATAWMTRPLLSKIHWLMAGQDFYPLAHLSDGGIAMAGALLLFVIPAGQQNPENQSRQFVMDWQTAEKLPWGIMLLFGGGLTLAAAVQANGVAEFIGCQSHYMKGISDVWLVLIVCITVIFLTELTSNTATAATLLPVLAAMAPGLDVHPYLLIFPTTIAASCAFMLPVATPPNAIVFASGNVTIPQMAKAGLGLNLIGVVLITLLTFFVIGPLLGM